jgi:3-dehydroquinate dehydratase-1
MQQAVTIRNKTLGGGKPWIIVPMVGKSAGELVAKAREISGYDVDMVEWRADFYEDVFDHNAVIDTLAQVNKTLGDIPLLFTFRTANEGGEKEITPEAYAALNGAVVRSDYADAVDVEIMGGDVLTERIIRDAHQNHTVVVASNHDFHATPEKDEIIRRLRKMQDMHADVLKIAVMPRSMADVLTLMTAVNKWRRLTQDGQSSRCRCPGWAF